MDLEVLSQDGAICDASQGAHRIGELMNPDALRRRI
jgi:hypothetical protein